MLKIYHWAIDREVTRRYRAEHFYVIAASVQGAMRHMAKLCKENHADEYYEDWGKDPSDYWYKIHLFCQTHAPEIMDIVDGLIVEDPGGD